MRITNLPASSSFASNDVLAIEVNGVTYKLTGATLAAAVKTIGDYVTTTDVVTTTTDGLMTSADKVKLNGIASGAQVNTITGVKGGAESSYRTGNVNLTPTNVGAVAKTGDTLTGVLNIKSTSVDISAEDNGVSSTTNFNPVQMRDKDDDVFGLFGSIIYANGDVRNRISVTNGGSSASFSIGKHKNGNTYYTVDDASALRSALDVYSKSESQNLPVTQINNITITTTDSRVSLNQANVFRCGNIVFGYVVLNVDSTTTAWEPGANGIRFSFNNLPAPKAYVTIPTIWATAYSVNIVSNVAWSVNMRLVNGSSVSGSGTMSFNVCYIAN